MFQWHNIQWRLAPTQALGLERCIQIQKLSLLRQLVQFYAASQFLMTSR
jgi:hypothetical protein